MILLTGGRGPKCQELCGRTKRKPLRHLWALFRDDWRADRFLTAAPVSTTLTEEEADRSAAGPAAVVRGLWVREAPLALDGVVEPCRLLLPLAACCCWLVRSRRRASGETGTEGNSSG